MAGYAALGSPRVGFPSPGFFAALDPQMDELINTRLVRNILPVGDIVGRLTDQAAQWMGLLPGTPVGVPIVDSFACVPATTVTGPGQMVAIMGTSNTLISLGTEDKVVPGIAGFTEDSIIPQLFVFAAGQSAVGVRYLVCRKCHTTVLP